MRLIILALALTVGGCVTEPKSSLEPATPERAANGKSSERPSAAVAQPRSEPQQQDRPEAPRPSIADRRAEAYQILIAARIIPGNCELIGRCGDIVTINCNAEGDGPLYYIDTRKNVLVMCCGGCCMSGPGEGTRCTRCPPPEWKCQRGEQRQRE